MRLSLVIVIIVILTLLLVYMSFVVKDCHQPTCEWPIISMESSKERWNHLVTNTYVLTLEDQHEKQRSVRSELELLDIPFKFWMGYDARKKSVDHICSPDKRKLSKGYIGCFYSHLSILKSIKETSGWTVIFEDDAVPSLSDKVKTKSMMVNALEKANEMDGINLVYFGSCGASLRIWLPFFGGKRVDRHLWNVGASCFHSFAIRNEYVKQIVSKSEPTLCYKNLDVSFPQKFGKNSLVVFQKPYKIWNPWNQFFTKGIHSVGIFSQRRDGESFQSAIHFKNP